MDERAPNLKGTHRVATYSRAAFLSSLGVLGAGLLTRSLPADLLAPRQASPAVSERLAWSGPVYEALARAFARGPLFYDVYPRRDGREAELQYTTLWPFSVITSATLDMFGLPRHGQAYGDAVEQALGSLRHYSKEPGPLVREGYDPLTVHNGHVDAGKFNDDNAWVGLNLLRARQSPAYAAADERRALLLEQAQAVFRFIMQSQTADADGRPGGVYWKRQYPAETNHHVNTVSSAPTAQLALQLYAALGQRHFLDKALELYAWVNATMRDRDLLYWDHVDEKGFVDKTKYTYNQGSMVGLNVQLFLATGEQGYLREAEVTTDAILTRFQRGGFAGHIPEFRYILFKNLLYLSSYSQDQDLKRRIQLALDANLEQLWRRRVVHPTGGLFQFDGNFARVLHQAAAAGILALAAWRTEDYRQLF
ncbi:MAG: glycoside hydrolase family 76 protein [Chloroflexota bacterium]